MGRDSPNPLLRRGCFLNYKAHLFKKSFVKKIGKLTNAKMPSYISKRSMIVFPTRVLTHQNKRNEVFSPSGNK